MSKYLTTGWEKFYFIVTPAELEAVLTDMHLLIVTRHVPSGYQETPLQEYIADYQQFYRKMASGQKTDGKREFHTIGATRSLENHPYGRLHMLRGVPYQLTDFDEPCPIIGYFPFYLYTSVQDKPTLTISCSTSQFPENTVGLELFFPKWIQYTQGEDYSPLQTTTELASYQDFLAIRDRIKAITKPLRISVMGKEIKPRVRISRSALEDLEHFWFLKEHKIQVIK